MPSPSRKFDLNFDDALSSWQPEHGLQELLANAQDEQALTRSAPIEVRWEGDELVIADFGRGLRAEHLVVREDADKLANAPRVIGRLGCGLNDALACLHRHGVEVVARSRYCDLRLVRRPKHQFEDLETLHVEVSEPSSPERVGTEFRIRGVSREAIDLAKGAFRAFRREQVVGETEHGDILARGAGLARVYVNGVLVTETDDLAFSYDLRRSLKSDLRTHRDRRDVGPKVYEARVQDMLLGCHAPELEAGLAAQARCLVEGSPRRDVRSQAVAARACLLLHAAARVVFASKDDVGAEPAELGYARAEGYEIVVVPKRILNALEGARDATGEQVRTLARYIELRSEDDRFAFVREDALTEAERAIWLQRHAIVAMSGGMPPRCQSIVVGETIRPWKGREVLGVWDPAFGRIVVRRSQLAALETFAATLLHELAHAHSGHGDVTEGFEHGLTELLGRVAAHAIAAPTPRAAVRQNLAAPGVLSSEATA